MQQCKQSLGLKKPRQGVFGWMETRQQVKETWPRAAGVCRVGPSLGMGEHRCQHTEHNVPPAPRPHCANTWHPSMLSLGAVCPSAFQQPPSPATPRVRNVMTSQSQVGWAGIPHTAAKGCQAGTSEHSPAPHTAQDSSAT